MLRLVYNMAMPAKLSPEFKQAEDAFRAARDNRQRLACLKEMLRTIPKHKGTDHMQADIKRRIKQLSEELAGPRKGGARTGPATSVRPEGAAQVALLGPPNSGKSALHVRLTGSRAESADYPFTTKLPVPGMLDHMGIQFQLLDLPPVDAEYMEPWLASTLQTADAALLLVDISDPACVEQAQALIARLDARKITLSASWPGISAEASPAAARVPDPDPFRLVLPTLLLANKTDLDPEPAEVRVLEELLGVDFPALSISATQGLGVDRIGPFLFQGLQVLRIYTKTPGKPAEQGKPFAMRLGDTVQDVARLVHKDLARELKFARIWGKSVYEGQQVGPEHALSDGDVVELHMH